MTRRIDRSLTVLLALMGVCLAASAATFVVLCIILSRLPR